jgi:hypothetical protein
MASNRTNGIQIKIERANKHIGDLDAAISDFLGTDFYALGTKHKPEIGQVAYYVTRADPLPDDIPAILGDAIHNLRSALDHLAWQLVEVCGGQPGSATKFPITKTRQQYDSAFGEREITQLRPTMVELLRSVQPYRTTDDTLWHLHRLDIHDKHRLIIPVACALDSWGLKEPSIWLGDLSHSFRIELGEELLNIPASTYVQHHENINFKTDIAFEDLEIACGNSVLEALNQMKESVNSIVVNFSPFLV